MKPALIEIKRYCTRNWEVYEGGELLAVTVYKKGALAVARRLGATYEGMAAWFGVSTRTIERPARHSAESEGVRMAAEKGEFCRAYKKGLG